MRRKVQKMKKIIILAVSSLSLLAFTGCSEVKGLKNEVTDMGTEVKDDIKKDAKDLKKEIEEIDSSDIKVEWK
ncbi:MAG: hypothetical protein RR523_14265 [Cetobacterium sp.]|uniref:hypothetical protein n=1 Tax=Cetobacterium sp. TaxID=2071632 RepID=UPI002FC8290C